MVLSVNGELHTVDAEPGTPLLYVLRGWLGLTAAKFGCGLEQCLACSVLVDGVAHPSCVAPAESFVGREIITPEGVGRPGNAHPIQCALIEEQAAQCGFCIPGIVVSAKALLDQTPSPSDEEIERQLAGHLCRCGSHPRIVRAVRRAAAEMAGDQPVGGALP